MRHRVIQEIGNVTRVDVGESEQSSRKICRIVIGAEDAAELFIENAFGCMSKIQNKIKNEYLTGQSTRTRCGHETHRN